ncbi:MAG: hypothetical protein R2828_01625 [Saprospiraceae bacterium]
MKTLLYLFLLFTSLACQSNQGQITASSKDFEKKLLPLYFGQDSTQKVAQAKAVESAIQQIRKSDLAADTKFELWYYLNQLTLSKDLATAAAPHKIPSQHFATFIPTDLQQSLLKDLALAHFQKNYLHQIIRTKVEGAQLASLDETSLLFRELMLYQFKPQDRIGEIGAGDGGFSLLLQLLYGNSHHFINEIDSLNIRQIGWMLQLLPTDRQLPATILGSEVSSGMEGKQLDALIIRNTLHHFSKPDEMMQSIKASLSQSGHLYLFEELADPMTGFQHCEASMSYEEVVTLLAIEGFELLQKHTIGEEWRVLFVFGRKKS